MEQLAQLLKARGLKYRVKRILYSVTWRDQDDNVEAGESTEYVPVMELTASEASKLEKLIFNDDEVRELFYSLSLIAVNFKKEDDPFEQHLRIMNKMCAVVG